MTTTARLTKGILYFILISYVFLLIYILFLTRINSQTALRSYNLVPFSSIIDYLSGRTANLKAFAFSNVVGNIVMFIPFGIYLSLFTKKRTVMLLAMACISSFVIELLQFLFRIGSFDIDDVILNTVGAGIGILIYKALLFALKNDNKARTAIAIISAVIGLPVIYFFAFVLKLRL